jgi:hypothetical protein
MSTSGGLLDARGVRQTLLVAIRCVGALALLGLTFWWALGLAVAGPGGATVRVVLAVAYAVAGLWAVVCLLRRRRWRPALAVFAVALVGVLGWWTSLRASSDRAWAPEVSRLAHATVQGDLVTVHDIRNFEYRSETDFTPGYYDRTFDLRKLDSVDLLAAYWMGPAIAHVFLSFGFSGDHLAVSIEARKVRGEGYSSLKGFFRQYELVYVVADERDVIRLRTNHRKDPPEEVYLYRLQAPVENARRVFLDYVREINRLHARPEFYNTVTSNCTTNVVLHTRVNPDSLPFSWKLLLSGYAPEFAYDNGRLDRSLPFEELRRRSLINGKAQAADRAPDFSRRIREGLPGMTETAARTTPAGT